MMKSFSRFRKFVLLVCIQFVENLLFSETIQVTNTDNDPNEVGTLAYAIINAVDGSTTIDCSPIAGQTININNMRLPALGGNFTLSTSSINIMGNGVILDGGSSFPVFSLAQGSASITGFTIQNGFSKGGNGGNGITGGGGGTGGGGALYVHSGSVMTISASSFISNQAVGGNGGNGAAVGGSGGGGGGFGGGAGGSAPTANAGSGGGAGGNNGGSNGGTAGGVGTPNTFSNFSGAGGGGETAAAHGKNGGSCASSGTLPAHVGGISGGTTGAGGGAGTNGSGFGGTAGNVGGASGFGVGVNNTYGAGGGGGGGSGGGAGLGASGGGGGLNGPGGAGGVFGGGGGASGSSIGGNGGFGSGGGAGATGGVDPNGIGGSGATGTEAGGGGGSGLGGAIFVQEGALLILQDGVSFSGNSTTAGNGGVGTVVSGANGSSLGADMFIQPGGSINFQINGALTLSNPIGGGGLVAQATEPGVVMSGAGIVGLTGINTYLGGTLIQSGNLNLNGSVNGNVQIALSGTLSGNATVNGSILNSGTIKPGNSIGTVITTNLILNSSSVYDVELNSAGQSDKIIATGFAQISGGVVAIPDDTNFTSPITYTIITTGTGYTGSFSSLTSSSPALLQLIYDPLTIELVFLPLGGILTGNALNAASCFSSIPLSTDSAALNSILLVLSFDEIEAAFEQMSPAQFSGAAEVQLLDAILVRSSYTKHLQEFCFNEEWCCEKPIRFWVDAFGKWQHQKKQFGYHDTTAGGTIGFDFFMPHTILGVAFSSTYDHFHLNSFGNRATINSYYGGFFAHWNYEQFYLNATVIGATNKYWTHRQIHFGPMQRETFSKHKGSDWLTHLGFGYQVCSCYFQWTPYINLDFVQQHERSYTESGAASLNLQVHSKHAALFQGEAGILFSANYSTCYGTWIPWLTLAYINQTPTSSKNYRASFVNSSCTFVGKGGHYERNLFAPSFALTYKNNCDWIDASIYYNAEVGSSYWSQDVGFDLTFRF